MSQRDGQAVIIPYVKSCCSPVLALEFIKSQSNTAEAEEAGDKMEVEKPEAVEGATE